ncbi:hypothetical protein ACX80U_13665 [Arthrobacter sp. TmT3-37]
MIVAKKWVAAGSTATLLAGGLFLGAPMASAAPGDAACLQASTQFNAALGAAGVDLTFVTQFETVTAAVVTEGEKLVAVTASLNLDALVAEADRTDLLAGEAQLAVENAKIAVEAAVAAAIEKDEQGDGNPENDKLVTDARANLLAVSLQESTAVEAAVAAAAAAELALNDPALLEAQGNLEEASVAAQNLLQQLSGDAVLAQQLLDLFKAFLAACDAGAIGVDPVTPVVVPAAPVAPVAPVAAPAAPVTPGAVVKAPAGTNKGLNVQTAVATEDNSAAVTLIAALLAVGVAVPVATAARMRRLERAQR